MFFWEDHMKTSQQILNYILITLCTICQKSNDRPPQLLLSSSVEKFIASCRKFNWTYDQLNSEKILPMVSFQLWPNHLITTTSCFKLRTKLYQSLILLLVDNKFFGGLLWNRIFFCDHNVSLQKWLFSDRKFLLEFC